MVPRVEARSLHAKPVLSTTGSPGSLILLGMILKDSLEYFHFNKIKVRLRLAPKHMYLASIFFLHAELTLRKGKNHLKIALELLHRYLQ